MLLCPSMMCADLGKLTDEVAALENAGADIFHLDIMDGKYVPNFALGLSDVKAIAGMAHIPCDVHLMIEEPGDYVDAFVGAGASIVYIHPESDRHPARTLQRIASLGAHPGLAIDTGTSLESVSELLPLADYVLAMTVNPGFAGQPYCSFVDGKLERLVACKDRYSFSLLIDGACSPERIEKLSGQGVDGFVLGTSALFGKGDYTTIFKNLRGSGAQAA
jgi:ribulose-phosphate 3-epimerase